ncbi:MAG: hypothetical protein ABIQ93_05515 [Saprospiraceae bacterium]
MILRFLSFPKRMISAISHFILTPIKYSTDFSILKGTVTGAATPQNLADLLALPPATLKTIPTNPPTNPPPLLPAGILLEFEALPTQTPPKDLTHLRVRRVDWNGDDWVDVPNGFFYASNQGILNSFLLSNFSSIDPFDAVFIEIEMLKYLMDFPNGTGTGVNISLVRLDLDNDLSTTGTSYKSYQGVRVWPSAQTQFTSTMREATAYHVGPICPPAWRPNTTPLLYSGSRPQPLLVKNGRALTMGGVMKALAYNGDGPVQFDPLTD